MLRISILGAGLALLVLGTGCVGPLVPATTVAGTTVTDGTTGTGGSGTTTAPVSGDNQTGIAGLDASLGAVLGTLGPGGAIDAAFRASTPEVGQ